MGMYMLLAGYPPYAGDTDHETHRLISVSELIFPPRECAGMTEDAKKLTSWLLTKDHKKRCTVDGAMKHDWITMSAPKAKDISLKQVQLNMRQFNQMSSFQRATLHIIAKRLDSSEIHELMRMFDALDTNHDSTVTLHELKDGLEKMGNPEALKNVREMFESIDMDASKRIDYTELLAATLDFQETFQESRCWAAFRVFDRDNSGRISKKEVREVLQSDGVKGVVDSSAAERIVNDVDKDGDGELDFHEFLAMLRGGHDTSQV